MSRFKVWHDIAVRHSAHELHDALQGAVELRVQPDDVQSPQDYDRLSCDREVTFAGYRARYQRWHWDGISGSTLIFLLPDMATLSGEDLKRLVEGEGVIVGEDWTRTEHAGQVFFNFAFDA